MQIVRLAHTCEKQGKLENQKHKSLALVCKRGSLGPVCLSNAEKRLKPRCGNMATSCIVGFVAKAENE